MNYKNRAYKLLEAGKINAYLYDFIKNSSDDSFDKSFWKNLKPLCFEMTKAGVSNDEEFDLYFNINKFSSDILSEFQVDESEISMSNLRQYIFEKKSELDFKNLTDFRVATAAWLKDNHFGAMKKVAHPNTGTYIDPKPQFDLEKWGALAKEIYYAQKDKGMDRYSALDFYTKDMDKTETFKFKQWMEYYEKNNHNLYSKRAESKEPSWIKKNAQIFYPKKYVSEPTQKLNDSPLALLDLDEFTKDNRREFKGKMLSRIRSINKLIDDFDQHLAPKPSEGMSTDDGGGTVEKLHDIVYNLHSIIRNIKAASSQEDYIYRAAGQMKKLGFGPGAKELIKIAQEAGGAKEMNELLLGGGEEETAPMEGGDLAGTEDLATPVEALPAEDPLAEEDVFTEETPEDGESAEEGIVFDKEFSTDEIVEQLERISKELKEKSVVLKMAEVDIMLRNLGIAHFFTEVGSAQARLTEAILYSSTKVDDVLSKLKAGGGTVPEEVAGMEEAEAPLEPVSEEPAPTEEPAEPAAATPEEAPPAEEPAV